MSKRPILTIGMPTCYDFSGALQSVMALKMYHDLNNGDLEIIVVDNTPDAAERRALRDQIYHKPNPEKPSDYKIAENVKYFEFTEERGPAETKNMVFENATGEYVMCIDSHVLLKKDSVQELISFLKGLKGEDRDHFYTGPLRHNGGALSTHWNIKWRGQMLGTWGVDAALLADSSPKDIPANGCGLILCRKDSWLGFNKDFNGFGGEEVYIHDKYRKEGRRVLLIPNLEWWHRFGKPNTKHYNLSTYSKVRNYVIGYLELGKDIQDIYDHFVSLEKGRDNLVEHLVEEHSEKKSRLEELTQQELEVIHARYKLHKKQWEWLIKDPVANIKPTNTPKEDLFKAVADSKDISDMSNHFGIFRRFAEESKNYAELTRRPHSWLPAGVSDIPVKSFLYNSAPLPVAEGFENVNITSVDTFEKGLEALGNEESTFDMVFLKLPHEAHAGYAVLDKVAKKANKFIAIHDTKFNMKADLGKAIEQFVEDTEWNVAFHSNAQYGFTVLTKDKVDKKIVAWVPEIGPGTEMKKLLKKVGIEATPDCSCNARAVDMNVRGEEWCLNNLELIVNWLEYEAKRRQDKSSKLFTRTAAKLLVKTACALSSRKKKKLSKKRKK